LDVGHSGAPAAIVKLGLNWAWSAEPAVVPRHCRNVVGAVASNFSGH